MRLIMLRFCGWAALGAAMLVPVQAQKTLVPPPAQFSLPDALQRVVATDRTLAVADYEVRKSVLERLRAYTRLGPRLTLDSDASWQGQRERERAALAQPATPAPAGETARGNGTAQPVAALVPSLVRERRWTRQRSNSQSLGLNLSQPLLDFTVAPAKRQAELLVQISQWELRQRLREVLFNVTSQYFEVLRQTELVEENKKTLGQTTEAVRQAEGRLKAQEVIESDVLQARVSDEQARRAVMEAEISRDLAKAQLAVTLDYLPQADYRLESVAPGRNSLASITEALSLANQGREEIRVALLTMNRTQAERAEIEARFAPTLDLQFGGDLNVGSEIDRRDGWNAGISFSWALFDRGERLLDLKTNSLQLRQDQFRVEDARRIVSSDVVDAWFTVERGRRRLESLKIERSAADANYTVQQGKYKAGLATALEVQTALRDLARVRIDLVGSQFDLEVAYRDLENMLAVYEAPRITGTLQRLLKAAASHAGP